MSSEAGPTVGSNVGSNVETLNPSPRPGLFERIADRMWRTLISLKFAVVVMAGLAVALALATILESKYDTKTAQVVVYRSYWFYALLASFGMLITAVAISRWPWKKRHIPFLLAHLGIILMLIGSWITYVHGVDGNLRISEGEVSSAVELDSHVLVFRRGEEVKSVEFPWLPSFEAEKFNALPYPEYGVQVSEFISNAELKLEFAPDPTQQSAGAVQFKVIGAPMMGAGGSPELWLWGGDPVWATQKMGLARILIRREDQKDLAQFAESAGEAKLDFVVTKKGGLRYEATSIRGEKTSGALQFPPQPENAIAGTYVSKDPLVINPGWKMPIQFAVKRFVPSALNQMKYIPARAKGAGGVPMPAIRLQVLGPDGRPDQSGGPGTQIWLGLGDRAELKTAKGEEISVGYFPKRLMLPFAMRLKRFEMKHNPGTMDPSAYSSQVQVVEDMRQSEAGFELLPAHVISMNEPLKHGGYTFYQASYIPDTPRPTTTILSVNYDPGRSLKYLGSLLIAIGSVMLYLVKLRAQKMKNSLKGDVT